MLVLTPMGAIRDRFGSAFEMNLEAVPFANGIKSAPRRAEREAENVAVNLIALSRSSTSNCGAKVLIREAVAAMTHFPVG